MDVELTPERQERLAEAGYVPAPALGTAPIRGRIRVQDSTGSAFDLELVDLPDGARETSIAHVSGWFSVADPGVEALVDALDLDDAIGYLTGVAAPCTLETFVEVTGRLGAGHTSTLLVTLGRALARLHARGLRYGPIRPRDVLVDGGRVLLTVPRATATGATPLAPSPQEDAYHLAALADAVIAPAHGPRAGDHPEPGLRGLTTLIVSALGDATTRPGVGTLATLSHDLAPCLPLVPRSAAARGADEMGEPGEPRLPREGVPPGARASRLPDGARRPGLDRPPHRRKAFRGSASGLVGPHAGEAGRSGGSAGTDDLSGGRVPLRGAGGGGRAERRRSRAVTAVAVGAVLAALVGGGVAVHRSGADAPAQAATPTADAPVPQAPAALPGAAQAIPEGEAQTVGQTDDGPGTAAARLTSARMETVVALTNAPVTGAAPRGPAAGEEASDGWADVLVPDSPAHLQAAELVSKLRADGARISGLTVETADVVVLAQVAASASAPATAQVQVTFSVGAYTLESPAGSRTVPAGSSRTAVLELVETDSGWLVAAVREVAPPA